MAVLFTQFSIASAASKLSTLQVEVADISDETVQLRLAGLQCDSFIASLGAGELVGQPHGSHAVFKAGMPQGLHNVSVAQQHVQLLRPPCTSRQHSTFKQPLPIAIVMPSISMPGMSAADLLI